MIDGLPYVWGATHNEAHRRYPADDLVTRGRRLTRAVDVAAPADMTFEWICQLNRAPYSYDWLDNLARRSPRQRRDLELGVGDRVMIFKIVAFDRPHQLTATMHAGPAVVFGRQAVTYAAEPIDASRCRLVCRLVVPATGLRRALLAPFACGDLVMMRKQLLTLAGLAEQEARSAGVVA